MNCNTSDVGNDAAADTSLVTAAARQPHHFLVYCLFCRRSPAAHYALTVQRGESWERVVQPICARCHDLLTKAGDRGRKLKGAGKTWYLGHGVGLFEAPGDPL